MNASIAQPMPPAHCPQCGEAAPPGLLQGLCPACVARQATRILSAQAGASPPNKPEATQGNQGQSPRDD